MSQWLSRWNRIGLPLLGGLIIIAATAIIWRQGGGDDVPRENRGQVSLAAGDAAPEFSLAAAGGEDVSLADFSGKTVLLYFSMGYG